MFFGRGSLPANYEDFANSVSAALSLPTPVPQFAWARFAMAGRLNLGALNAGVSTVQQFVSIAGGGQQQTSPELDALIRIADMYPDVVKHEMPLEQKGIGDTIKFTRPIYGAGGLTEAYRKLTTSIAISTTGVAVTEEEVPLVIQQYHGPVASGSTTPAPFAIADFDAKYRANKIQLASKATAHLKYDYTAWLDAAIRNHYASSSSYITFSDDDYTAVTDYVPGGRSYFTMDAIARARKSLRDRNWKPFPNGRYICVVPTCFETQMLGDVQYRESSKFHADGRNQIFGYIASWQDVDFYECSTNAQYASTQGSISNQNWGGSSVAGATPTASTILEEAILIGPGAVGMSMVLPPECRFSDLTNYGTMALVIWYAVQAQGVLDERGIQRIIAQST